MSGATALEFASRLAWVASNQASAEERGYEILQAISEVVPFVGGELSIWDPVRLRYQPLANDGYPDHVLASLNCERALEDIRALEMASGGPMRMRDVPARYRPVFHTLNECLIPAGYREGLSMCLHTPDSRQTGILHLSVDDERQPTDAACELLAGLNVVLASVCDVTRSSRLICRLLGRGAPGVALTATGQPIPLPGLSAGTLLEAGSPLLAAATPVLAAARGPARFLWPSSEGEAWQRVTAVPCREPGVPQIVGVVTVEQAATIPYELTKREVEVLSLITLGLSNAEIGGLLVVSRRTVSTHVEHVLEKLSLGTRAAAAAVAVNEGLVLADTMVARSVD